MDDRKGRMAAVADAILMRSVAGAGEESVIREEWKDIIDSRHRVRMRQFWATILGCLAGFVGLLFVGVPLWFSGAVSTWWDALLVGCFAALAVLVFWAGVEISMGSYSRRRRLVVVGMGVMVVLAAVVLATLRFGDPEWWHPLAIVAGLCILGPAVLLVFNQGSELVDPMGWPSSYERRTWPLIERLLNMELAEPRFVERSLFPYSRRGQVEQYISAKAEQENVIDVPAQNDLNLRDFLEEARRRGIARSAWLAKGQPRYRLPTTGARVTRSTYDRMVEMAARMGYVLRGGEGEATGWLINADDALADWSARLEEEWGSDDEMPVS